MATPKKSPPIPHQKIVVKLFHGIIIISLLLMIGSGLQIYNATPVFGEKDSWRFPDFMTLGGWLAGLFVNWQTLRTVHFMTVPIALIFTIVHMLMGLKVGGLKIWRSMFV